MKTLLSLAILFSILSPVKAQFALEHTYPNAATPVSTNQLYLVDLETIGQRYVFFDKFAKTLTFFDLDHNQTQVIDLSAVPDNGVAGARQVLYISQHLFDLDDGIEVMYFSQGGTGQATLMTSIVDESGAIIQSFPDEAPYVQVNVPQRHFPIYATPQGTKLILSDQIDLAAHVYALPGELTAGIAPSGKISEWNGEVKVFPNPNSTGFQVELTGFEVLADVTFQLYDQGGHLVLQRQIVSKSTAIPRGSLAAGHYLYTVVHNGIACNSGSVVIE